MEQIQEVILYGGTVKVKFVPNPYHQYWIAIKEKTGWSKYERKIGATTIIGIKDKSIPLKFWVARLMADFLHAVLGERPITKYDIDKAKGLHTEKTQQAADIGTKIHDWIEEYIKGKKPEMPVEESVLLGVNSFLEWEKKNKVKWIISEIVLYSKKYGYFGKADAVAEINSKLYLVDFKTGTTLYNEVILQTAGYSKAYEEQTKVKLFGRIAVRIEKRTKKEFEKEMDAKGQVNAEYKSFEAKEIETDIENDFEAFLAAQKLYYWNKTTEKYFNA